MADTTPILSTCSMAMLAALVTQGGSMDPSELLIAVPPAEEIEPWFDDLQALLDAGFVRRIARRDRYAYATTAAGSDFLFGHIVLPRRSASA